MSNNSLLAGWRQKWNKSLFQFLGRRVRTAVDIEDLAQETYLRLLRARDLGEVRNPQAYVMRVARHVMLEWRNDQAPRDAQVELDDDLLVDDSAPELELEAQQSQQRLDQVLASATPVLRAVLILRIRDELPCAVIAEQLGLTERQVKRHLARGYDRLRVALEK
jgi:RNA polymerase sigma-70 factor (ECF subfamily)